MFGRP